MVSVFLLNTSREFLNGSIVSIKAGQKKSEAQGSGWQS